MIQIIGPNLGLNTHILMPGFINYPYTMMDIKANMYMVKDVQRIRATYALLAVFYFNLHLTLQSLQTIVVLLSIALFYDFSVLLTAANGGPEQF